MQSTERPSDFKKDPVKDLRETNSLGFPLEEKDFHNKIPKIEIEESPADEANKPNATPNPRIIKVNNPNNPVKDLSSAPKTKQDETTKPSQDIPFNEQGKIALFQSEELIKNFYDDQTGKETTKYVREATIGYGHKIQSPEEFAEIQKKYPNGMTQEEAIELFNQKDLPKAEKIVKEKFKDVKLTQNEYNALVMRAYNAPKWGFKGDTNGSVKMVEYINGGKDLKSEEFAKYYQKLNTSGGKYMRGLEKRRIRELDILQNNDYTQYPDQYYWNRRKYGPKK